MVTTNCLRRSIQVLAKSLFIRWHAPCHLIEAERNAFSKNKNFERGLRMRKNSFVSGMVLGALTLVPMTSWAQSSSQTPGASGSGAGAGSSSSQGGSADKSTGGSGSSGSMGSSGSTGSSGSMGSSATGSSSMGSSSARGQWSREDVKSVQEALKGKGLNPGPIDGVMGPQTQQALRSFQRSQNIQQSGQLDSSTASALGVQLSSGASGGAATGAGSSATGTGSSSRGGSTGTGSSSSSGSTDSGSSSGAGGSSRGGAGSGTSSGTGSGAGSGAGSSSGSSGSSR